MDCIGLIYNGPGLFHIASSSTYASNPTLETFNFYRFVVLESGGGFFVSPQLSMALANQASRWRNREGELFWLVFF